MTTDQSATMADLPPPPVPVDADLTDFRFMPLEVARLRRSRAWLLCKRRPELAFFMLNLWTAAWHDRPAGSLEDDDDVLADAAMCSPERWAKVRKDVMRGWFKASDGRLYHPVVAEKVLDSWHGKAVARWRKECDRIRKENGRREKKKLPPLDFPPEPARPSAIDPEDGAEPSEDFQGFPSDASEDFQGHSTDEPRNVRGNPPENALKGEGRKGKGEESKDSAAARARGDAGDDPDKGPPPEPAAADPDPPPISGNDGASASPPKSPTAGKVEDQAFALWQASAASEGWPEAGYLTTARRFRIGPILTACGGVQGFAAALDRAKTAAFLHDDAGHIHGWFDFDWLLDEQHFARLMEGRYDHRSKRRNRRDTEEDPVTAGIRESLARRHILAGG